MSRHFFAIVFMSSLAAACGENASVECGSGTHLEGDACVPDDGVSCGPGTVEVEGECLPDGPAEEARYEVRVAATEISGNGYAKLPVFAIGTLADGTPSLEPVIFSVSRAGAGNFADPVATLTASGVTNYYTACNTAVVAGCAGPFQITLALGSDPETTVAVSPQINLVEPSGVGSLAACAGGGNVVFMDGEEGDWIHPWVDTITDATWSASVSPEGAPDYVRVSLEPADDNQGSRWGLDFSTSELGQALQTQVYQNAERYPFEDPGHPGLDVSGDGRGCNTLCGSFQIHELEVNGTQLERLAATFEQNCECGTSTLRGCIVYEGP